MRARTLWRIRHTRDSSSIYLSLSHHQLLLDINETSVSTILSGCQTEGEHGLMGLDTEPLTNWPNWQDSRESKDRTTCERPATAWKSHKPFRFLLHMTVSTAICFVRSPWFTQGFVNPVKSAGHSFLSSLSETHTIREHIKRCSERAANSGLQTPTPDHAEVVRMFNSNSSSFEGRGFKGNHSRAHSCQRRSNNTACAAELLPKIIVSTVVSLLFHMNRITVYIAYRFTDRSSTSRISCIN